MLSFAQAQEAPSDQPSILTPGNETAAPAATGKVPELSEDQQQRVAMLVNQLGGPTFKMREDAGAELLQIGEAVMPWLSEAAQSPDLEVRKRAQVLQSRLRRNNFERIIAAFLDGTSNRIDGWEYGRKVLGDSMVARELFVDAMRAHRDYVSSLDQSSQNRSDGAQRVAEIINRRAMVEMMSPQRGDLVALLMSCADPDAPIRPITERMINRMMHDQTSNEMKMDSMLAPVFRQLAGNWVRRASVDYRIEALSASIQHRLPSGLELARRVITDFVKEDQAVAGNDADQAAPGNDADQAAGNDADQAALDQAAPGDDAPGDDAPGDDAPGDDAPGDDAPGDAANNFHEPEEEMIEEMQGVCLEYALQAVAVFGNKQDLPLLEKLIYDRRQIPSHAVPFGGLPKRVLQLRDVALASAIMVLQGDLIDAGFEYAQTHAIVGFSPSSLAFHNGEDELRRKPLEYYRRLKADRGVQDAQPVEDVKQVRGVGGVQNAEVSK